MKCYNCNKPLSDPLSVKLGIGPDCRKKIGAAHKPNQSNLFSNRAEYSWGTEDKILWLKDHSTNGRSLTNDMENCLVEIQVQLKDILITDYTIVYKDSCDDWDGVQITRFDRDKIIHVDAEWIKAKGGQYAPQFLAINFYYIGAKTFNECTERLNSIKIPENLK